MESNEILREQIFEIIANQMRMNDPPETNQTFKRLKDLGYSAQDAKKLIGQCLTIELFNVFKNEQPFDNLRYINNLKKLPNEPTE